MGAARRAWDAAKHPRGPNGRFIKAGSAPEAPPARRPSLADSVLGTAAGGPKRQRRTARDLMSDPQPPTQRNVTLPAAGSARPKTARGVLDAARVAEVGRQLSTATSRDTARKALAGLTKPQLRAVASANSVSISSGWTADRIREQLTQALAGRRLDSQALSRR